MKTQINQLTVQSQKFIINEMRDWLSEIFNDEVEEIMRASESQLINAIEATYDGGLTQFVQTSLRDLAQSEIELIDKAHLN